MICLIPSGDSTPFFFTPLPEQVEVKYGAKYQTFDTISRGTVKVPRGTDITSVSWSGEFFGFPRRNETASIEEITAQFETLVKALYTDAKANNVLRYNDVRPLLADISGVTDFSTFLMNGSMDNITLANIEYPATGTVKFS